MHILLADSGSTKTDWLLCNEHQRILRLSTPGINPVHLDDEAIETIVQHGLLQADERFQQIDAIRFYGAGCSGEGAKRMHRILQRLWQPFTSPIITVDSDLVGAAAALAPQGEAIVCILGTGSNSGLFRNGKLIHNVSPLGYILGDEGSGAVIGRRLLGDILKQQLPQHICDAFTQEYPNETLTEIIRRVYRAQLPNRYLASFAPFVSKHIEDASVSKLICDEMQRFLQRNVKAYNRPDLPIHFVGSIAAVFEKQLRQVATSEGLTIGTIKRVPLDE